MGANRIIRFPVPGSLRILIFERTEDGRLLNIQAGGRIYVDMLSERDVRFDGGFAQFSHIELPGGLLRRCATPSETWTEHYRWDEMGRLIEVDGTRISYDQDGRIISCRDTSASWFYAYSGPHLSVIDTPSGTRHILRAGDGRAYGFRQAGRVQSFDYDSSGHRLPRRRCPANWHFDDVGRLWSIADDPGEEIVLTYLWDGWHCLGAIAGEPGAPLSAVYSLDPTGTPVRVITNRGVRRIPRDAFGESLLRESDVPGLYGGAIRDSLVHLPFRRLDPLTGSFDAPDPANGESADPRRAAGWTGPLPIELPASGPYTVCRNNPVSLADPTGAISDLWWLIPSALTWSMQNTVGSLLGMWLNLEFSPLGWIVSAAAGAKPFDAGWISAHNFDSFGLRSDGWMSRIQNVAWTYQFLVNEESSSFDNLEDSRVFVPDSAFQPRLYGSMLRCVPKDSSPFLINGQRTAPNGAVLTDWSRCGGTAQPAMPGSRVPIFPQGGFHLGNVQRGVRQQTASLVEVEPAGVVLTGVLNNLAALLLPRTGLGLAANSNIVATDPAGVVEVLRVVATSEGLAGTTVNVDSTLARLANTGLRIEGLTGPLGPEPLNPVASNPALLRITGSSNDYQPTLSVLRLSRAASPVHYAKVTGFETQLAVDSAVPATVGNDFLVRTTTATGNFNATLTATPTVITITSGSVPGNGTGMLIGSGASAIPVIVQSAAGQDVTVDRNLSSLGPAATNVTWQNLSPVSDLGPHRGAPEGSSVITYSPPAPGGAPSSGFVWVQGAIAAIRRVTGINHEALVMSQPRPDAQPDAYDVERFRIAAPDVSNSSSTPQLTFSLSGPLPNNTTALHVVQFPGTAIAAGTRRVAGATLTGTTATTSVNPSSPPSRMRASEAIVVTPAAGQPQAVMIKRVRLTVFFDRRLPVGSSNLEAALLALDTMVYSAERRGDRVLKIRPLTGTTRIDLPRFAPGDLLQAQWTPPAGATETRFYRVISVTGATVTCGDDEDIIPAATTGITVTRLLIQDPATGSARLGLEGEPGAANEITFTAWDAAHFPQDAVVAIIDGPNVFPVQVASTNQPLTLELIGGGGLSGVVDLASPPAGSSGASTRFVTDELTIVTNDLQLLAAPPSFSIVVPYADTTRTITGQLQPGNVRIPEDHENAGIELTRRQSLDDHELTHTLQSAKLGPIMLVAFPLWAVELGADFSDAGGPQFTTYVAGRLALGILRLTTPGSLTLEVGDKVQIAQSRRAVLVKIDMIVDGGFRIREEDMKTVASSNFRDGEVQIRRQEGGTGSDVLEWIVNIGQLLTIGGLLNVISVLGWGGVAALITQIVNWIRAAARPDIDVPLSSDQRTLTLAEGQELSALVEGTLVALKQGDKTFIRAVESINGRVILLGEVVPLSGTVNLSVYSPTGALFGSGRRYFPAAIPDETRPARIEILPVGENRLSLALHDRIEIRHATGSAFRTLVTLVDGNTVEVSEAALLSPGMANEFLVSKIGEQDPTGWVDQWMLNELNISWMQYFHDPWGQIVYRTQPTTTAGQFFSRAARYLFGTQSWMCIFLGFFWNDNAYRRGNAERSRMEQEASKKSGDTYSPIGTLHGELAVVGDVVRYWLTGLGGRRDLDPPQDMIVFSLQDAPGVNLSQAPTLTLPGGTVNAVAPDFLQVNNTGTFSGIGPRGWIPASASLERSSGFYAAFTRPPGPAQNYTFTAQAAGGVTTGDIALSNSAQTAGRATFSFSRPVFDVVVTLPGQGVGEGATLNLIPFQRATFTVTPNGSRVYRVTAAEQGVTLDADGLTLTARNALTIDDVEISRFHRFNAATGAFDSGIGPIHLPADIDIAVRRFAVSIQDQVPLRATIDPAAAAVTAVVPGDTGFLLIPAPIAPVAVSTAVTGTPSLTPATAAETNIPAGARTFLGDGGVIRVTFPNDQPPEQQATVTITVSVGPDAASAIPVRSPVTVDPHFTLDRDGGGALQVARGASIDLRSSDGTALNPASTIAGITLTANNDRLTVAVDAAFASASLTLLVADSANPNRMARRTLSVV